MTTLNYSPLTSPVTRQDIAAFRRESAGSVVPGSVVPKSTVASVVSLVLIIIVGLLALSFFLSAFSNIFPGGSTIAVLIATMVVASGVMVAFRLGGGHATWARLVRLSRFTQANNLSFKANGVVPDYPGAIFGIGSARRVPERISRASRPSIDLGNLNYTTGSGKNRTVHRWGYLAIKLDRMLPNMVLDAKSNNFFGSNLPIKFSRSQVLSLEGDFDKYFTLYCPREYERDALYVFTPDLMARLIDEAAQFDVEIVDDWMFVYSSRPFDLINATTIARVFRIVDTVGDKTVDRTERYADERVVDDVTLPASASLLGARMATNAVARQGRRLQRGIPVLGLVIFVAVVAVWLLNFLPMFSRL